jgi:hypothetical protein
MKERILRIGVVAAIALALPGAATADPGHGQQVKAEKQHQGRDANKPEETGKPDQSGKPDETGKPESAGDRPHNHGWYVSQIAKDETKVAKNDAGETTHGAAVSAVAQSDQGK